jgi:hypothetical protein
MVHWNRHFLHFLTFLVTLACSLASASTIGYAQTPIFFCRAEEGVPTTIYRTSSLGEIPMIRWVSHDFLAGQSPQRRCESASSNLQVAYDNGTLEYIHSGESSEGQPAICVGNIEGDKNCSNGRILILLNRDTDANAALGQLLRIGEIVSKQPLYQSGDLLFYVDGEAYINVDVFIEGLSRIETLNESTLPTSQS